MESLKILVVEDEKITRDMLALKLAKEGYVVETAETGAEALPMIADTFYDVIISDLMMPGGVDGIGVLEAAKARSSRTDVLILTAHASVQTAVTAMRKGATNYIQKPVNFYELMLQLDKISSFNRLARSSAEMREALDVTEQNAAQTIQDLEMAVDRLQGIVEEAVRILAKQNLAPDKRVELARQVLAIQE